MIKKHLFSLSLLVLLLMIATFMACQGIQDPDPMLSLNIEGRIPQKIAVEHNRFLTKIYETRSELEGIEKLQSQNTAKGRITLLKISTDGYFQENPEYSENDGKVIGAKAVEYFTALEKRNSVVLAKKIKSAYLENAEISDSRIQLTGIEFIQNMLDVKVELGLLTENLRNGFMELIHYTESLQFPANTEILQDYAEKEILTTDWTQEEKRQISVALAVLGSSQEYWTSQELSDSEMAKISSASKATGWCDYWKFIADAGGAMIGGGATLPFAAASIGFAAVAGGYTSYLYEEYICS